MDEACFMSESLPEFVCQFPANWSKLYQLYIYVLQQYITSGLQTISRCWHCIVDPVSGIFPILPGSPALPLNNREHHETAYRKKNRLTLLLVSRRIYVMCYVSVLLPKQLPVILVKSVLLCLEDAGKTRQKSSDFSRVRSQIRDSVIKWKHGSLIVICHSESFLVIIVHLCVYKESGPTLHCCMLSGQPRLGPWNKELGSRCRHPGHSPRCLETCFQQVTEAKSLCSEYIRWISYEFLLWEAVFFNCSVNPKLPKEK